jgi:hypothetical protein
MINEELFATDLTEADLFDRRSEFRRSGDAGRSWRLVGECPVDTSRATVHDFSATGIGLLVPAALPLGTTFVLTLQTAPQRLSPPLPVRVMHATRQADGNWLLGCQFVRRLTEQDLQGLLGGK